MSGLDRFTPDARRVLAMAQANASRYGHAVIDAPHLLLALWQEPRSLAARVMRQTALNESMLIDLVRSGDYPRLRMKDEPRTLTPECQKVIRLAVESVERHQAGAISPDMLLLNIVLCDHPGIDALLARVQATYSTLRTLILIEESRLIAERPSLNISSLFRPSFVKSSLLDRLIVVINRVIPIRRWLKSSQDARLRREIANLDYLIHLRSNDAPLYQLRADAYFKLRQYEKAAADYNTACSFDDRLSNLRTEQIRSLIRARRYADLLTLLRTLDAHNLAVRHYIGRAHMMTGNIGAALAEFEAVIAADAQDDTYTLTWRAWVRMLNGATELALADCEAAIALHPNYPFPYYIRGLIALHVPDLTTADAAFRRAVALKGPSEEYVHAGLALCYARRGHYDAALKEASITLEDDPHHPIALFVRAVVHRMAGRHDAARADTTRAMRDWQWQTPDAVFWKPYFDEMHTYLASDT